MEQEFTMGQVLSAATGTLMCEIGGVYEILNYMTGESLMTHQLPRVIREAQPVLLKRHPWLADIDMSDVNPDNCRQRLDEIIAQHGARVMVPMMTIDQHERIDPLSEAAEKFHPDRIVVVPTPPSTGEGE